ncbi:hypothetical protein [Pseudomonas sp. TTU2014-080ASC]|uniref:hypothetical protein n=1 Tax=Pseudomonas sp. TTU2014-080ASC TaxID=1729724 RepID=UPI00071888D6|nr:hypothetical protein [Pseudomonas sp. TTU2014-080ASC]KRW58465.1 hypothetical protein AO726_16625 [Pseudomonas sp. TTU2014-080ASC]
MDWFVGKTFRLSMVVVVCLSVAALVYFLVKPSITAETPKQNPTQIESNTPVATTSMDKSTVSGTDKEGKKEEGLLANLGVLGSALTTILSLLSLYWSKREEWARKKLEMKSLDIEHAKMELELQELRKKIANGQSA